MLYWKQELKTITTLENNSEAPSSDVTGGYLKGIARNILLALDCNVV